MIQKQYTMGMNIFYEESVGYNKKFLVDDFVFDTFLDSFHFVMDL